VPKSDVASAGVKTIPFRSISVIDFNMKGNGGISAARGPDLVVFDGE
jgi:hypothetical protein